MVVRLWELKIHLFFITRGCKADRDQFVNSLSNMWLPTTYTDENGNTNRHAVQGLLQPIELWSFAFPSENLDQVLRTLQPDNTIGVNSPVNPSPKLTWALTGLRKMLKLKKIPAYEMKGNAFPLIRNNIKVSGIGIKEDYKNEFGNEVL